MDYIVPDPNVLVGEPQKSKQDWRRKSRRAEINAHAAVVAVEQLCEQPHTRACFRGRAFLKRPF
jgi:hypothetical protein